MGNTVTCVDKDIKKIENLKKGFVPIYEPGLEPMVQENNKKESLAFSSSLQSAMKNTLVIFIAVGTPMAKNGCADLQSVLSVAKKHWART